MISVEFMFNLVGPGMAELRIKCLLQNLQVLAATLVPLLFMIPTDCNFKEWIIDVSSNIFNYIVQ